jgi:preprotein translocase SecF subunit
MIKIIQRRKIWFVFSLILTVASIFALAQWNLKMGIDFTGGTLMEFSFKNETLNSEEIKDSLKELNLGEVNVQFSGEKNVSLRFKYIDESTHEKIKELLRLAMSKKSMANETENMELKIDETEYGNEERNESKLSNNPEIEKTDNINNVGGENAEDNKDEIIAEEFSTEIAKENIDKENFYSVDSVIGNELKVSAIWAIAIALIGMVLYIGWAFRKVSRPVSSFKYGIIATIALFHDVVITLGVFSVLGYLYNIEIGLPFVAAILAILGYSVNDTIVVFDRTRENLIKAGSENFEDTVNRSVNETLIRSLNASFTTLLVLFALFLFGGETIKYFIVALIIGIAFGTYSSIFIASPLLVTWQKWSLRKNK